jgi:hypothetical protein
MSQKNYIQQVLDQCHNPSPKSELLPYQYYDSENNLFINKGSNIGFLLQLNPIVGVTESILKQLSLLFDEFLPANGFLQFMMIASHNIESITRPWLEQYSSADDLLKNIASKRVMHLEKMTLGGEGSYRLKNYNIVVSFSQVMKYTNVAINDLNNFRNQLEALLRSAGYK